MSVRRRCAEAMSLTSTPALLLAVALGLPSVAGLSLACLALSAAACPKAARRGIVDGARALVVLALLALAVSVPGAGLVVFAAGMVERETWLVLGGAALAYGGFLLAKAVVRAVFFPKPKRAPAPASVIPAAPVARVEIVRPQSLPTPVPPPAPPKPTVPEAVKKRARELVLWAGMLKPAREIDQGFYVISGPPGRGKTSIQRLFLKGLIEEVLDPDSDSVLIAFDPKRELYAWIASQMPKERESLVPLWLFCPSDQRTCTLDWTYDFYSPSDKDTFSYSMSPVNQQLAQQFFENAFRSVVAETVGAIQRKLGYWDLRLLMNALSDPNSIRKLVGSDKYAAFIKELLSAKSEETAQNVQMEITSKLSKWMKVAAHLSHVKRGRTLSLERFLSRRGILVIQKDDNFREQHNAINAMLLQRIGQILMSMQADPTGRRKVYVVIDEFPSLGYIPGMVDMFRELRSRGVVFLVSWQSWANMEHVWKEEAYSIQNTLQSFIVLGSGDPKDAEHAVKMIGKVRGWEAEHGESASSGTSENQSETHTEGEGWSTGKTRRAGTTDWDWTGWFGTAGSDSRGRSGSTSRAYAKARGVTHSDTRSVTWRYYERDIKTTRELLRSPWPNQEDGFRGVGYCAGEPDVCEFHYESAFMEEQGLFEKNDHIPDYMPWPSDKYQLLEGFTRGERERIGLDDVDPPDPRPHPTPEEARAEADAAGHIDRVDEAADGDGNWDAK